MRALYLTIKEIKHDPKSIPSSGIGASGVWGLKGLEL